MTEDANDTAKPSRYIKYVKEFPYDIAVLQVSSIISALTTASKKMDYSDVKNRGETVTLQTRVVTASVTTTVDDMEPFAVWTSSCSPRSFSWSSRCPHPRQSRPRRRRPVTAGLTMIPRLQGVEVVLRHAAVYLAMERLLSVTWRWRRTTHRASCIWAHVAAEDGGRLLDVFPQQHHCRDRTHLRHSSP